MQGYDLKRALEASPNDPNVQQLLADLDSPAYAHRIEQFHRLQEQTKATVEKLAGAEIASSQGFYRRIAADSFYRSTFALQQQTGLGYQFNSLSEAEIDALLRSNWEGGNFSKRIWNNTQSLSQSLKNEMLVSLMTGKSNKAMAEVIERKFNTGKANARRLVRTETAFFHGQMELKSYEEADVEWYRFVAVLDLRTSEKCQHQDGETYKVSEAVEGVNYPPLHPYCRSTTIASDDKEWLSKLKRRARDPETGKTVLVPADMKYKEWYEEFVEKKAEQGVVELSESSLGQARKAGEKVFITKQAIEKVPEIQIPGNTALENKNLRSAHQHLLQSAMTRNNSNEVMHILTGDKFIEVLGNQHNVNPNNNPDAVFYLNSSKARTLTIIHNHPGGSTFSLNDLNFFMKVKSVKTLTAVSNTGRVMYITKTDNFDFSKAIKLASEIDVKSPDFVAKVIKKMYNAGIKYKLK